MTRRPPVPPAPPDCNEPALVLPRNLHWSSLRHFLTALGVCLLISLVMFMFYRRDLLPLTVYSICIGMPSAYGIRVLQYGLSRWLLLRRPGDMRLQHGWVGWGWSMPCIVLGSFFGYVVGTLTADWLVGHRSVYIWEQAPGAAALSLILMMRGGVEVSRMSVPMRPTAEPLQEDIHGRHTGVAAEGTRPAHAFGGSSDRSTGRRAPIAHLPGQVDYGRQERRGRGDQREGV